MKNYTDYYYTKFMIEINLIRKKYYEDMHVKVPILNIDSFSEAERFTTDVQLGAQVFKNIDYDDKKYIIITQYLMGVLSKLNTIRSGGSAIIPILMTDQTIGCLLVDCKHFEDRTNCFVKYGILDSYQSPVNLLTLEPESFVIDAIQIIGEPKSVPLSNIIDAFNENIRKFMYEVSQIYHKEYLKG